MEIQLNDLKSFKDIQNAFNKVYPFLWIDFFYHSKRVRDSINADKISPETAVKNLCTLNGYASININSKETVAQLENDFLEKLQVKIKVLRKSGNVWVGTSYTRNWTLENQNFEGQQIIL